MSLVHLHLPCIQAEDLTALGYPAGGLHRKVLEEKLGRQLLPDHDTHHLCENKWCIEPTHLEEKPASLHRSNHMVEAQARMSKEEIRSMKASAVRAKLEQSVRLEELFCRGCEQWKPDEDFSIDSGRPHRRGRQYRCRECQARSYGKKKEETTGK